MHATCRLDPVDIAIKFHQDISWCAQGQSEKIVKEKIQKPRQVEQTLLYATHGLNLIHTALKFHQDILYSYLLMVPTRPVKTFHQGEVTQTLRKGEQYFLYATLPLNLISTVIMINQDITYSHLLIVGKGQSKINQREVTQKVRKGERSFFVHDTPC